MNQGAPSLPHDIATLPKYPWEPSLWLSLLALAVLVLAVALYIRYGRKSKLKVSSTLHPSQSMIDRALHDLASGSDHNKIKLATEVIKDSLVNKSRKVMRDTSRIGKASWLNDQELQSLKEKEFHSIKEVMVKLSQLSFGAQFDDHERSRLVEDLALIMTQLDSRTLESVHE